MCCAAGKADGLCLHLSAQRALHHSQGNQGGLNYGLLSISTLSGTRAETDLQQGPKRPTPRNC